MRRNGFITIGLVLMVALAAGVLWATGTKAPLAEPNTDGPAGEEQVPVVPEEQGLCTGSPICNDNECTGSCHEVCEFDPPQYPTGWTKCCHNGSMLDCGPDGEVGVSHCDCKITGGGICAGGGTNNYACMP